jgi:MFS family permease
VRMRGQRRSSAARIQVPLAALREVLRNSNLRRVLLASAGFVASEWAYTVAVSVYAFRIGGATAVGLVGLIRMFPVAFMAPVGSLLLDTRRRERMLVGVYGLRALMLGGSGAAAAAHAHAAVVYVLAGLLAVVSAMLRPIQWSLVPLLAETTEQLAASNAASSLIEGISTLIAPAVAGALLVTTSPATVFFVCAGIVVVSALLAAGAHTEFLAPRRERHVAPIWHDAFRGFRALAAGRQQRLLTALAAAQTFVRGALTVLVVVVAIDLVKIGDPGVGYLTAAFGAGGVIGAIVALTLAGRRRLASPVGAGLLLWGIPIALLGLFPSPATALLLLVVPGVGNAIFDLGLVTLLQRTIPNEVLGRAFGAFEGLVIFFVGVGSIVAAPLINWIGIRSALVAVGMVLPGAIALSWRALHRMDATMHVPEREIEMLRAIPMFAPLPGVALEHAAVRMRRVAFPAGSILLREGAPGDRFYVLVEGTCEVTSGGRHVADRGPGDYFGEIALLRDVPRTATVEATTDVVVYALEREDFVAAVTGHTGATAGADAVVGERLEGLETIRRGSSARS